MIYLGKEVRFTPSANQEHTTGFGEILGRKITGTVVQIHEKHHWHRVQYTVGTTRRCIRHECFKFTEEEYHENENNRSL